MHNMTICICSDSMAALLALSLNTISSKLVHQCWLSLQDLFNNNRVRLFWVPGHCDIKGNGEADRLARMGSDSHFCGPDQETKRKNL
jgi:ribonuclease HI